jgi:nuclear pore complex protein Nup205
MRDAFNARGFTRLFDTSPHTPLSLYPRLQPCGAPVASDAKPLTKRLVSVRSMESLTRLRSALLGTLEAQNTIDEQELFDLLVLHRRNLVNLFDAKPPSEDERKELQGGAYFILFTTTQTDSLKPGKCTVDGRQMSVNNDFATQVIYLAQVLGSSERYIARLMQYVISNNPNFSPVNILEEVVLEHHRRRRDLADCIRFLLEAAELVGSPGTTALHARLELFVTQQLIPSREGADGVTFGEKGLGWKVLSELEALDHTISLALAAKQNAGSNTTIQGLLTLASHCP